jgi:Asp-tRNA(Asn)/Glu-tRNA(Gln) amidotransferase A subunit family amidase
MGGVEIEDCVTMAQFTELKQSMKDKQDRLSQDLQALMAKIREHRQPHDNANASHHEDEVDEMEEEATARLAREQRRHSVTP